jgi:hypothetical protein
MKDTKTEDTENKHTSGKPSDASTCSAFYELVILSCTKVR